MIVIMMAGARAQNKKTEIRCVKFKTKANLHPPSHRTAPPNWLELLRKVQEVNTG